MSKRKRFPVKLHYVHKRHPYVVTLLSLALLLSIPYIFKAAAAGRPPPAMLRHYDEGPGILGTAAVAAIFLYMLVNIKMLIKANGIVAGLIQAVAGAFFFLLVLYALWIGMPAEIWGN